MKKCICNFEELDNCANISEKPVKIKLGNVSLNWASSLYLCSNNERTKSWLEIAVGDGELDYLVHHNVKIHYCPLCGRKLD